MKTTLNLMLGSLILVSVAGHAAGQDQVRTDNLIDVTKATIQLGGDRNTFFGDPGTGKSLVGKGQVQLPGDQFSPKKNAQRTIQPTQTKQRSIGETEKNLITRPPW